MKNIIIVIVIMAVIGIAVLMIFKSKKAGVITNPATGFVLRRTRSVAGSTTGSTGVHAPVIK